MAAYQIVTCYNWRNRFEENALVEKAALWPAPSPWWINSYSMYHLSGLYQLVKTERPLFQSNRNELSTEWLWMYGYKVSIMNTKNIIYISVIETIELSLTSVPHKSRFQVQPLSCCVQNQPLGGALANRCSLIIIRESLKYSSREVYFLRIAAGFWPETLIKMSLFTGIGQCFNNFLGDLLYFH